MQRLYDESGRQLVVAIRERDLRAEEAHLDVLKAELAERVMAAAAPDVYDLDEA